MSTTYTYRAYWREQGATDWNEIQSPSPITWDAEIIEASGSTGFQGGQCPSPALYRVFYGHNPVGTAGQTLDFVVQQLCCYPGPIRGVEYRDFQGGASIWIRYGSNQEELIRQSYATQGDFRNTRLVSVERVDGPSDDCGDSPGYSPGGEGGCKTTFSTGLVIIKPECIEVTLNPPECECCKELLPKANAILARLG